MGCSLGKGPKVGAGLGASKTIKAAVWAGIAVLMVSAAYGQVRPRPRPALPDAATVQPTEPQAAPQEQAPAKPKVLPRDPTKGAVTNLPIPRFVTLKGGEGNARRGPGLTHRIDWVFTTAGTPLRITAEFENWRRVEDFEGMGGWVHFTLLSGVRSVLVTQDMAEFHALPEPAAPVEFQAEAGTLARVMRCTADWCRVKVDGFRGWVPKSALWGVELGEVIE